MCLEIASIILHNIIIVLLLSFFSFSFSSFQDGGTGEIDKVSIEREERRLTEIGQKILEIFVLSHIFRYFFLVFTIFLAPHGWFIGQTMNVFNHFVSSGIISCLDIVNQKVHAADYLEIV